MKIKGKFFIFLFFLCSCARSPLVTGIEADDNLYQLTFVQLGMTHQEILHIMGDPYHINHTELQQKPYEIWYYVTSGLQIAQLYYHEKNFTPLIFQNGVLKGIGYPALKNLEEDPRLKRKQEYYNRVRSRKPVYEPLKKEHGFVPPPPYEKTDEAHLKDPFSKAVQKQKPMSFPSPDEKKVPIETKNPRGAEPKPQNNSSSKPKDSGAKKSDETIYQWQG